MEMEQQTQNLNYDHCLLRQARGHLKAIKRVRGGYLQNLNENEQTIATKTFQIIPLSSNIY